MAIPAHKLSLRGLLLASLLAVTACRAQTPSLSSSSSLQAGITFACLWWSQAQMEGMNPNSPPPKETEVKITKWEYSDPIGVPHPDRIDLILTLSSKDPQNIAKLDIDINGEWKIGAAHHTQQAVWGHPTSLRDFHEVVLDTPSGQIVRIPVEIKAKMDELSKNGKWPFAFRATVTVHQSGSAQTLTTATATLPISPGD